VEAGPELKRMRVGIPRRGKDTTTNSGNDEAKHGRRDHVKIDQAASMCQVFEGTVNEFLCPTQIEQRFRHHE
jgi:hypothetical protein